MSYPLLSCVNCSHVTAHPLPSDFDIDRFYGGMRFWKGYGVNDTLQHRDWFESLVSNSSLWENFNRAKNQLAYILEHSELTSGAKIIDFGSGLAPFLCHCRQRGFENLYALEPSAVICAFLKEQGVMTFPSLLEVFIARDDLPKFDLMVVSHTLEHLKNPAGVLEGLREHLSENGVLYVDVPYKDNLKPYHQGLHFHFFNETSMREILQKSGYRVISTHTDGFTFLESALIKILYFVYGLFYGKSGGVSANKRIDLPHRLLWRPLKWVTGLKINIFISSMDLRAVVKR